MATYIDFAEIRKNRQIYNNKLVQIAIKNNDLTLFYKMVNKKELNRVLDETHLDLAQLIAKCQQDDIMCIILAGRISKLATRQGNKDEQMQLNICNSVSKQYDIHITQLTNKKYRPTKDGKIITANEIKTKQIGLDQCLKSFDAQITGKINGWVFSKVSYGSGGHQDNVFEEADCLCEWVKTYQTESNDKFIILIDTNLNNKFNILKEKFKDVHNIVIVNHYEFQQYILTNYSDKI